MKMATKRGTRWARKSVSQKKNFADERPYSKTQKEDKRTDYIQESGNNKEERDHWNMGC